MGPSESSTGPPSTLIYQSQARLQARPCRKGKLQTQIRRRELRCLTINTRSIRSTKKLRALHALLLSTEQDLICLSETFLNDEIPDSLLTAGAPFSIYRRDRVGRMGGGVAILVRDGIDASEVSVPARLEVVSLDIRSQNRCFRIICCYKPPNAESSYVEALCDCITSLCSDNSSRIPFLVGDFNFPKLEGCFEHVLSLDRLSALFSSTVEELSLSQLNRHPSRETNSNILDLVFCPSTHEHLFSSVTCGEPFEGSDHFSLSFSLCFDAPKSASLPPFRNFRKGRYEEAKDYLSKVDWHSTLQASESVECFLESILSHLRASIELFIPLTKPRPPNSLPPPIMRMRKKRQKLFASRHSKPAEYREAAKNAQMQFANILFLLSRISSTQEISKSFMSTSEKGRRVRILSRQLPLTAFPSKEARERLVSSRPIFPQYLSQIMGASPLSLFDRLHCCRQYLSGPNC